MSDDEKTILSIKNLSTHFGTEDGVAKAVGDVSFDIKKGKTFALVGESGCGKSVTALSIMRLVPAPAGKIVAGDILFQGQSVLELSEKQMRQIRGNKIAMIFQEPMTSLNPVYTIGNQIAEAIASKSPLIMKILKKAITTGMYTDLAAGLVYEKDQWALCFATEDCHEGIDAFLNKRKAEFKGK